MRGKWIIRVHVQRGILKTGSEFVLPISFPGLPKNGG